MIFEAPQVERLTGPFGCALTVDVEEWYHTCLVPDYVHPEGRPALPHELDWLLPELLEILHEARCTATFFVLGEVAERLPRRVRQIAEAGHEVASHGYLHLRACERSPQAFLGDLRRSKALLEDLLGEPVLGFRAPEWSLRSLGNARLPRVAEAGFLYDSSLNPCAFSGRPTNPRFAYRMTLDGRNGTGPRRELLEFPPLTFGGPLRLPAGSWTGRLVNPERLVRAALDHLDEGGLPLAVVHPWEVSGRPTPGPPLRGLARFVHETGRQGFATRFRELLAAFHWSSVRAAAGLEQEYPARTAVSRRAVLARSPRWSLGRS
ncbi:MAG TPA: polysaccharide deacetylase family protein [Thermoanaerobaculia bacterium]|jgi:polysaccharide deacetylase family protein (PEP-CTERM system associated)|nr:polysaccharide deacetylase family protein [Thermoanaerobaculia bacterium]